ncbi:hypothetical protein BJY52DRAFT_1194786 [Lactarius psammicola]|nr:hypothetical protein BJY52DRAFT_1194786 [Lactarius psammicola]
MSAVELFIALVAFYHTTEGTTLWFDIDARELEVSGAQGTSPPPDDPIHHLQGKRAAGAMATSEILTLTPELEQDSLHLASRPYLLTDVLLRATELHRIPMVSLRAALVTTSSRHFYASTPLGSLPVAFARNRLALVYPTFQLYVSHEYPNFTATEPNPLAVLFSRTARECEPFLLSQLAFLPHKSSRFGPTLRDHFVLADPLS